MKKFTKNELIQYHGEDDRKPYVAYGGNIYDLSGSEKWKEGVHMNAHHAGMDLTEAMSNAPHGPEKFTDFPLVGKLIVEEEHVSYLKKCLLYVSDLHLHSVFSHFTVSSFVLSPLFLLIHLFYNGHNSFEGLSFYLLMIGLLSLPFTILFGLLDWWNKYSLDRTRLFNSKLILSGLLFFTAAFCAVRRLYYGVPVYEKTFHYLFYIFLNLSLPVYVAILGNIGGRLVFPYVPRMKPTDRKTTNAMVEVLSSAIPRERAAYEFYTGLKKLAPDHTHRAIFDFLAHEEKIHEAKLRQILDKLSGGESGTEKES
jgi:predicted heme/steroid binding protein/uncharacterized membrane protein